MKTTYEIIEYNPNFPVKLFFQRIGRVSKHWHDSIEILLILTGEMNITIENDTWQLKEDDIILINSNQIHETESADCIILSIQLRLSMFHIDWLSAEDMAFSCNSALESNRDSYLKLKQCLALLVQANTSGTENNELLNYSYACQLMNELVKNFPAKSNSVTIRSIKNMDKLKEILSFMEEHYTEDITLNLVAKAVYLSPSYLSHFFEKNMGNTFSGYLAQIRLEHSTDDLMNTNLSIYDIALKNGFASARSFSTFYQKRYGMLPNQYRKKTAVPSWQLQPWSHNTDNSYLELEKNNYLDKVTAYLSKSNQAEISTNSSIHLNILPDTDMQNEGKLLKHTFLNFCSVGRAKDFLYTDIEAMFQRMQQDIGFKYVKFHGIFDDDLNVYSETSDGSPILNFYYIDCIMDKIQKLNLKPLIQLSFMPKALAKNPERQIMTLPFIISEPKDYAKWSYLVEEFAKHLLSRYGLDEMKSWIFTFWNETMNYQSFEFDNHEISFELYRVSYESVKRVHPDLVFASISYTTTDFPTSDYTKYLEYMESNRCMPDAFLFHYYATDKKWDDAIYSIGSNLKQKPENTPKLSLSSNPNLMNELITKMKEHLYPKYQQPIYLTEWNFSPSHREGLNDTCFSSCYIVRNILQNYDRIDSFSHWSLTDRIDELEQPKEMFHGGEGLFTRNGIPKPSYYAYDLLSKLESVLCSSGEGYFITRSADKHRYSIILYRYQHFHNLYAQGFLFNTNTDMLFNAFPDLHQQLMQFQLLHIPNGNYTVKETIINHTSGSVYDKWVELGKVEPENQEDIDTLISLSVPVVKKRTGNIANHQFFYKECIEPLEVRLIQIMIR